MITTRTTFDAVSVRGQKRFKCSCGRRLVKRKRFWQTVSPFNKTKSGAVKTRDEIAKEVMAERAAWLKEAEPCTHSGPPLDPEVKAFLACYRAVLALAKRRLAEANADNVKNGVPDEWPAGQEWGDLGCSSRTSFMRTAREEAGIDHGWYKERLEKYMEHVEAIFEKEEKGA